MFCLSPLKAAPLRSDSIAYRASGSNMPRLRSLRGFEYIAELLRQKPHPEQGYRACLGIMRLGRSYGVERLEAACARAERLESFSYTTIKNILANGQDRLPLPTVEDEADIVRRERHDNIRGPEYYDSDTGVVH